MSLISINTWAQTPYLKNNETALLSFKTTTGKQLTLAVDTGNKYIIYRFGTSNHIELEYPADHNHSFDQFKRFYYARSGWIVNAGMVINQLEFTNGDFTYKIYDQLFALKNGERRDVGVTITNNTTFKNTRLIGITKTAKGGFGGLEDWGLIKLSDGEFDH